MSVSVTVQAGFGSTWQTENASVTWTDITSYVTQKERISFSRGASSARGQVDAGQISFTLLNSDRRFDPTHTTGPYYGNLKPGVPIRLVTQYAADALTWAGDPLFWGVDPLTWTGGAGTTLWRGTVASWPQRYDIGNTVALVDVRGYDGFDKLARAKIPRSVLEAAVLATTPRAFWPLRETSGTSMDELSNNRRVGVFATSMPDRAQTIGTPDGNTFPAMLGDGNDRASITNSQSAINDNQALQTFVCLIDLSAVQNLVAAQQLVILERGLGQGEADLANYGPPSQWGVEIVNPDLQTARMFWASTTTGWGNYGYSAEFSYATARFVGVRASYGVSTTHYIDGVAANGTTSPSLIGYHPFGTTFFITKNRQYGWQGLISNIVWHDTTLGTAAAVATWSAAALAPLADQTSDLRIGYVLDQLDWPADLRDLDTGISVLGSATFNPGDNALAYLRQVDSTEYGRMFVAADGKFTFKDRYSSFLEATATVSQFTFSDTVTTNGYAEFQLDLDDELLVNVARVTRRGGTEQRSTDTASVALYGEADVQLGDLLHTSDEVAKSQADWIVKSRSTPLQRVPKIRVPLHKYATLDQIDVLALEIGHRVTVNRTPQGVGSAISLQFLVSGVTMTIDPWEWWVEFYVEPVPQDTISLFLIGASLLDSVTDVLAY